MESKPNLVVFYGSQTGNAQDVAERIGREAAHQKLDATVISMDTYDPVKC
jgi:sulfite reductase alpha subunit-like flavoprotein